MVAFNAGTPHMSTHSSYIHASYIRTRYPPPGSNLHAAKGVITMDYRFRSKKLLAPATATD
jgi:hypothetical protein